ncbi:MAG TPA: sce7726 family protein [Allosphingosinicella sp.]|jgi:hypothetical protein
MRDRDVRAALLSQLSAEHANDPDTRIVEEMGVWAGSARIDVAVINGELAGFELKSDRDTLDRLPMQAEIYSLVFDRVCLVTTERHLRKARDLVPRWWGTYVASEDIIGRTVVRRQRASRLNPSRDPFIMAQLLWREEALALLARHGLEAGWRSKTAKALHRRLAAELPLPLLSDGIRCALKARTAWLGKVASDPLDMTVDANPHPSL